MFAMPTIVQLKAADIQIGAPRRHAFFRKGKRGIGIVKPGAFAFGIRAPRPGADDAVTPPAGFGQRQRAEDVGGNARLCRGGLGGPFAQRGGFFCFREGGQGHQGKQKDHHESHLTDDSRNPLSCG